MTENATRRSKRGVHPMTSLSIRNALLLVVILAMVPALAIIIWSGIEHGSHLANMARDDTVRQAESMAHVQERITDSGRQILSTLASIPSFKAGDAASMHAILQSVHAQNPDYLNLTVTDTAGIVTASSLLQPGTDLSQRLHVRTAITENRFVVGEYIVGLVGQTPSIAFAYPLTNPTGYVTGSITATYKLSAYAGVFDRLWASSQSILGLVDRNGDRLFFYPPLPTNPVGGPIKRSLWTRMIAGTDSGTVGEQGSDGVQRLYAYRKLRLSAEQDPYMYVVFGTPVASTYAVSRFVLARNIVLMVIVACLALATAYLISGSLIGTRLTRIVVTTSRIMHGDLSARVGLEGDHSDLGQIAAALDEMAGTIERRDAERDEYTGAIARSLGEKEILLREIHHRVKNNLQLILSLFALQDDVPTSLAVFRATIENRVRVMAMVHEMLYESNDLGIVDLGDYTRRLVTLVTADIIRFVAVTVEAEPISGGIDMAVPFGLLLNELVTNACKHAFLQGRHGTLKIDMHKDQGMLALRVVDDGPGLPQGFSVGSNSSLGLRLVEALASQLGGALTWTTGPGACFSVRFPARPDKRS
ncbi:MAG TPA: histidine kinase dimerization/phosphoacceptor domain -containing protein [bacterium]|nr:histidine kinase dimerization/phosphoacceptor domain -containing protein [bacterium]